MSPIKKTLIVVFGGMAVMVVTTACGAMIGYSLEDGDRSKMHELALLAERLIGGVIGSVVGVPIWVWLGYMVCREKKSAELPPGPSSG
jgi:hypothetical protein